MTFEHSIDIAASADDLFALTQDYDRRLTWDPFLRSAELLDGAAAAGVGVQAWCVAKNGLGMETECIAYDPPHVTAIKMTRGPWMIESFAGSWRFLEIEPGVTRVVFKYNLHARPRWLARLLTPMMTRVFRRDTRKRLEALKKSVERG